MKVYQMGKILGIAVMICLIGVIMMSTWTRLERLSPPAVETTSTIARWLVANDTLGIQPYTFRDDLYRTAIAEKSRREIDPVVQAVLHQFLAQQASSQRRHIKTDTIFGMRHPQRTLMASDLDRVETLRKEFISNPSPARQEAIQAEIIKIYVRTLGQIGIDRLTSHY